MGPPASHGMGGARVIALVLALAVVGSSPLAYGSSGARKFTLYGWANHCGWEANVGGIDYYGSYPPKKHLCVRAAWDQSIYSSAGMHLNGRLQQAGAEFSFFLVPNHMDPTKIKPFPAGMTFTGTHVLFDCAGGSSPKEKAPYNCRPYSNTPRVRAIVTFPDCWSGGGLRDVVYPIPGGGCPAGHRTPLPLLRVDIIWNTPDGRGATFTGGNMKATFKNGYQVAELAEIVHDCINKPTRCGAFTNYIHRDSPT